MTKFSFSWIFHIDSISPWGTHGPLFSQWLPNGEDDSICIKLESIHAIVKIWFNRYGYTDSDGFIKFDSERTDVDPTLVKRQGVLDAGPIIGSLIFDSNIDSKVLEKIRNQVKNDDEVIIFIKPIVKEISQALNRFVNILKYKYGQYWLPSIEPWDSRNYPLGVYCKHVLQLNYIDENDKHYAIEPDDAIQSIHLDFEMKHEYPEYLNEEDWHNIKNSVNEIRNDIYITQLLIESHKNFIDGDNRSAIVFGCTALELAISYYYDDKRLAIEARKLFGSFQRLSLKTQTLSILLHANVPDKAELFIYFIDIRNRIVHEGNRGDTKFKMSFNEFLSDIAKYFLKNEIKLPNENHGNLKLPEK